MNAAPKDNRLHRVLTQIGVLLCFAFVTIGALRTGAIAYALGITAACNIAVRGIYRDQVKPTAWVNIATIILGMAWFTHWEWNYSRLSHARRKCEEIRALWNSGQRQRAIEVVKDLADNQQIWEQEHEPQEP